MVKMRLDEWGVWVHAQKRHIFKKQRPLSQKQEHIVSRRRIVRQAYFLIRDDPVQKELVLVFARSLGGKIDLTDEILEKAEQTIHAHQGAILQ